MMCAKDGFKDFVWVHIMVFMEEVAEPSLVLFTCKREVLAKYNLLWSSTQQQEEVSRRPFKEKRSELQGQKDKSAVYNHYLRDGNMLLLVNGIISYHINMKQRMYLHMTSYQCHCSVAQYIVASFPC
jgi:hypothetical protein